MAPLLCVRGAALQKIAAVNFPGRAFLSAVSFFKGRVARRRAPAEFVAFSGGESLLSGRLFFAVWARRARAIFGLGAPRGGRPKNRSFASFRICCLAWPAARVFQKFPVGLVPS